MSQLNILRMLMSLSCKVVFQMSFSFLRSFGVKTICSGSSHHLRAANQMLRGVGGNSVFPLSDQDFVDTRQVQMTEEKVVMDEKIWSELPVHVLEGILAFLPPTSFLQQRSVCKDWQEKLTSTSFLELYAKVSGERLWFIMFQTGLCNSLSAYNPSMNKWHRISLSFLPTQVHCVAASGGLLVCKGENDGLQSLYICNPISRKWKALPPMIKKRLVPIVSLVVDRQTNSYSVIVAGDDLLSDGFNVRDVTTEAYDSRLDAWQLSGPVPLKTDLDLGSTYCNGSLYFITYCPYGVLSYNVHTKVWGQIQAPVPRFLITPSLVECQGKLFMVGGIEKKNVIQSIQIWELRENPARWEVVVTMPPKICKEFFKKSADRYFSSVGNGELICMTIYESTDVLAYDMSKRTWSWLPRHPDAGENFDEKHLWGYTFDPRLDLSV